MAVAVAVAMTIRVLPSVAMMLMPPLRRDRIGVVAELAFIDIASSSDVVGARTLAHAQLTLVMLMLVPVLTHTLRAVAVLVHLIPVDTTATATSHLR